MVYYASYVGLIFHTSSLVKFIHFLSQISFQDGQLGSRGRSVAAVWDGIPDGLYNDYNASHWCDNIRLYHSAIDYFHVSESVFNTNNM